MASVFVPSYELGADGTSLVCQLKFFGSDLQSNPTQIASKVAAAIRTLSASIRNNTGAAGVTVPANAVVMPALAKG